MYHAYFGFVVFISFVLLLVPGQTLPEPGTEKQQNLEISVSPSSPLEEVPVNVTCRIKKMIAEFHYMELLDDRKRVLLHKYVKGVTERRGPWKDRSMKKDFDPKTQSLRVTFAARPSDNGYITCRVVVDWYPNNKHDLSARVLLSIQRPPNVLNFRLSNEGPHGAVFHPDNRFVEGDNVRAECRTSLGHPQANVTLVTPGLMQMPQKKLQQEKDIHNYNISTVAALVKVSHLQDGTTFHCKASNKHQKVDRTIQISVLYKVRDLFFHYPNGTKIAVGTTITCQASGNPSPTINITAVALNITVKPNSRSLKWTRQVKLPTRHADMKIPDDAPLGHYKVTCEAINIISNNQHRIRSRPVIVQLIRIPVTTTAVPTQTAFNLSALPTAAALGERVHAATEASSTKAQANVTVIMSVCVAMAALIIIAILIYLYKRRKRSRDSSSPSYSDNGDRMSDPKSDKKLLTTNAEKPSGSGNSQHGNVEVV